LFRKKTLVHGIIYNEGYENYVNKQEKEDNEKLEESFKKRMSD
jgi:hypothetical protein